MVAINYGTMIARCALNANNLPTSDPRYTQYLADSSGLTVVNEAANRLILHAVAQDRRAVNCFPELRNRRWWDVTTANSNSMSLPDTMLVLEQANYTKLTTDYNSATQTEYPITEYPDPQSFGFLSKSATGWPVQWRRAGSSIEYWPTTSSSPTDYRTVIVLYGIRKEQTLTSNTATYQMNELWHPTIIKCATAILMDYMQLPDAANWWEMVDRDVTATINLLGLEQIGNDACVEIAGVPR